MAGELVPTDGQKFEYVESEIVDAELLTPGVDSILLGAERLADLGEGVHVVSKTWSVPAGRIMQEPLFLERAPIHRALGQLSFERELSHEIGKKGGRTARMEREA